MASLTRLTNLLRHYRSFWVTVPYDPDDTATVEYRTADGIYYRTNDGVYCSTGA